MEPNWHDGGFTFCCSLTYRFRSIRRGDVVAIRLAGRRLMYLKRIVALPGDTVEFRRGMLYINGKPNKESYVRFRGNWELPPRIVQPGMVYVVGDNRAMPMMQHVFGETEQDRIVGTPLW